jgi:hypothetical protein
MITELEFQRPVSPLSPARQDDQLEISRLLAAAVVSPSFCSLLLEDPKQAIENGYQGETFHLSDLERYLLLFIHADSLTDLARQVVAAFSQGLESKLPVPVREPAYC